MPTVGILGGGQLGLMIAESLWRLNTRVRVLEPAPDAPCAARLAGVLQRPYDDPEALGQFFSEVDVATYDSENIPSAPLAPWRAKLRPSLEALEVSQNRAREKAFLEGRGFGHARFRVVGEAEDPRAAAREFGLPCLAKTALGGYDGKGQIRLLEEADLEKMPGHAPGGWVLEEMLEIEAELSVLVARTPRAEMVFPVLENVHVRHILDLTVAPARLPAARLREAKEVAIEVARALDIEGLLTVEFFIGVGRDGVERLCVNELAPRVHNSGHVTRQACAMSQFDALARILSGVPLTRPDLREGGWCMGQILGEVWLAQGRRGGPLDLSALEAFPDVVDVYLYGKREARPGRKMGHFVVHAESADEAARRATAFREALMRRPSRGPG